MRGRAVLLGLAAAVFIAGCGGEECITVEVTCDPLYEPSFANVFANTLSPKCGTDGSTCHSSEGHKNGLILDQIDTAYAELLGMAGDGDTPRVDPGNPECSEMIRRIHATSGDLMPPRARLSDAERCALVQWVANGAPR
jgi:cytochrome c